MTAGFEPPHLAAPRRAAIFVLLLLAAVLAGCGDGDSAPAQKPKVSGPSPSIQITQIILTYQSRSAPRLRHPPTRTREESLELAQKLIREIASGGRMEPLVAKYTDDRDEREEPFNGGTTTLAPKSPNIYPDVVKAAFSLRVGEIHPDPVDVGWAFVVLRRDI